MNKIDLSKIFRVNGYHFPLKEEEVDAFEKNLILEERSHPQDWENPLNILKRGKVNKVNLDVRTDFTETAARLSMAARDGNEIPDSVRKRMNEDRKNSPRE